MNIIVCIKQVIDPESPLDAFKIDSETKRIIPVGIPPVISPYDENALEVAIRIKEDLGANVKAISLGDKLAKPVLRKALAVGVDELVLLEDPCFKNIDNYSTAYVLSIAIEKLSPFHLILTGRQAADWDFGVTGQLLAEMLDIPCINIARKIEIKGEKVLVERVTDDGYELIETSIPALITVGSEVGELRWVSINRLRAANEKPLKIYNANDLGVDCTKLKIRPIFSLVPTGIQRECFFIEGETPQEKAEVIVLRMKQDKLI